ncbi:MAG: PEP-CTERM sorting domain-containing protein [Terracidiphilus sp.]
MRTTLKVAVLSLTLLALGSGAYADTISIGSYGTNSNGTGYTASAGFKNTALQFLGTAVMPANEQDGYSGALAALSAPIKVTTASTSTTSYDTVFDNVWNPAISGTSWVTNTSVSGPACSGSQCDANAFYYYSTTFTAVGGGEGYDGSLSVMADDTAEVLLNGKVIMNFGAIGNDGHCSIGPPSCGSVDTISLSGIQLIAGTNTLEIINAQTGLSGAGVDFSANLTRAPEPSSLLLLGTGLLGLAFGLYRKRVLVPHE